MNEELMALEQRLMMLEQQLYEPAANQSTIGGSTEDGFVPVMNGGGGGGEAYTDTSCWKVNEIDAGGSVHFSNCYYQVGGFTYEAATTARAITTTGTGGFIALKVEAIGNTPTATLEVNESIRTAQSDVSYMVIPLWKYTRTEEKEEGVTKITVTMSADLRNKPTFMMTEFN